MKSPSVIFLDEPTSGLDAYQAYAVMETMKTLARNGRIVVAVIHQPRSSIFTLFDRLLLLSEGQTMYFGPASEAVTYFAELGYVCPQHFNPADFFLDLLSLNLRTKELEASTRDRLQFFATHWANCMANTLVRQSLRSHTLGARIEDASVVPITHLGTDRNTLTATQQICRWFGDFSRIAWRVLAETYRDYTYLIIRIASMFFFSALLSLIFQNLGHSQRSIQDRTGLLYFVLINQSFTSLENVICVFPYDKKMVCREIWSGAYKTSSYYAARVVCELPIQFLLPVLYSTIIYWSADLNPDYDRFLIFLLFMVLTTFVSVAMGFCLSALSPTAIIANAVGPPVLIVLILFGGFYINSASLPPGSEWILNLSVIYWGFQGLILNEFRGQHFDCEYYYTGLCVTTGEQVITSLDFENGSVETCIGALIVLFVVFLTVGYFGLFYNREKYLRMEQTPANDDNQIEENGHDSHVIHTTSSLQSHEGHNLSVITHAHSNRPHREMLSPADYEMTEQKEYERDMNKAGGILSFHGWFSPLRTDDH